MFAKLLTGSVAAALMLLGGCGDQELPWFYQRGSEGIPHWNWKVPQNSPKSEIPELAKASSCGQVLSYLKERVKLEQEVQLRDAYAYTTRYNDGNVYPAAAEDKAAATSPSSYTDTNNQVAGVEESDVVKFDGTNFYHLTDGVLQISKAWPASEMSHLATLPIENASEMLLGENHRLFVYGNINSIDDPVASVLQFLPTYHSGSRLTVVDIADPQNPSIIETKNFSGVITGVRRVGRHVRFIVASHFNGAHGVDSALYQQLYNKSNDERMNILIQEVNASNALIDQSSLADFLPDDAVALEESDCRDVFVPTTSTLAGLTNITTIDSETLVTTTTSLLAQTSGIYENATNLYLSTNYYWWDPDSFDANYFYMHRFNDSATGDLTYSGTAAMEGQLLNQFSVDEYQGYLRVAASVLQRNPNQAPIEFNRVYVFKQFDDVFTAVGMSEPFGQGESIYAVRFVENRGYVVTFRRSDPLFVIGFDDPVKPVVLGELKVPGYSTYIHPLGKNQLLAVGEDLAEDTQMSLGQKISLYDVSDASAPRELAKKTLPPGFYMDALYNHKSFKFDAKTSLLALPSYAYPTQNNGLSESNFGVGLYRIGEDAIDDVGFFAIDDDCSLGRRCGYFGTMQAFLAEDIVYGIDPLGISAAPVSAPQAPSWKISY